MNNDNTLECDKCYHLSVALPAACESCKVQGGYNKDRHGDLDAHLPVNSVGLETQLNHVKQ